MSEIIVGTAFQDMVRIYCLDSTDIVEAARIQHDLWPTASAALGRVLGITAIMGSMLKSDDEKIIVNINGGGPLGTVMAEAKGNGDVKGFVGDNEVYLKYESTGKLAVGLAVGKNGYLKVSKDLGLKDSFTGTSALQTGEIGDDFAYYFVVSEQIPSIVSLGVLVDVDNSIKAAGGLLIQAMPDCSEEVIVQLEETAKNLKPISGLIDEGLNAIEVIHQYFPDAKIYERKQVRLKCDCNRDRFKGALTTLSVKDLEEMIDEDHGAEVKCEYCNKIYNFSEEELKNIVRFKQGV